MQLLIHVLLLFTGLLLTAVGIALFLAEVNGRNFNRLFRGVAIGFVGLVLCVFEAIKLYQIL